MNNNTILERIAGANWRTSLSGIGAAIMIAITILAALPYELGNDATIIPADWKPFVVKAGLISSFILKIIQAMNGKDKQVVGNGTFNEPNAVPDKMRGNRVIE